MTTRETNALLGEAFCKYQLDRCPNVWIKSIHLLHGRCRNGFRDEFFIGRNAFTFVQHSTGTCTLLIWHFECPRIW